jgi:hypothetical protein
MLQWDRLTVPLEISGTRQQDSRPRDAVKLTATEESKTQLQNLPKWITRTETSHPQHPRLKRCGSRCANFDTTIAKIRRHPTWP